MAERIPGWNAIAAVLAVPTTSPAVGKRYAVAAHLLAAVAVLGPVVALTSGGFALVGLVLWLLPLGLLWYRRNDPVARPQAAEAANLMLTALTAATVVALIGVGADGLLLGQWYTRIAAAFLVVAAALLIMGAAAAKNDAQVRYPATFRLLR